MTGDGNLAILRCYPRMKLFMTCIRVCMMMKMCSGLCKHYQVEKYIPMFTSEHKEIYVFLH